VSAFVDTNILVRHLVGDLPDMAARATAYLGSESELPVADLVVAETVYVLESFDEVGRRDIATAMRPLLTLDSVVVVDTDLLLRSIEIHEHDRLDFAEAHLVASAGTSGVDTGSSFARSIDGVGTIDRIEPWSFARHSIATPPAARGTHTSESIRCGHGDSGRTSLSAKGQGRTLQGGAGPE